MKKNMQNLRTLSQLIACDNRTQSTSRIGPGTSYFIFAFWYNLIDFTKILKALSQVIGQNVNLCFFVCHFEDFHGKKQL